MNILKFPEFLRSPEGEGAGASAGGASSPAPAAPSGGTSPSPSSAPSGGAPSGGEPAPSGSTPSPGAASPGEPGSPPPDSSDDFFQGLEGLDLAAEDFSGLDPSSTELTPPTPPQPQTPLAAPTPPQGQPPAPAQVQPQAPQPPGVAPGPGPQEATAPLPSPAEPAQVAAAIAQNADAIVEHLAQNEFQMSQEDLGAMESDFAGTFPKILAKMYVRSQIAALNQLQRVVPAMLQQYSTVTRANRENEGMFYSRWPDIKVREHGGLVRRMAQAYRQANPQATRDQMIEDLGPMVMMAAKITPTARQPNGGGAPMVRTPPASPFVPAVGGPASPQPAPSQDVWAGLGGDFDEE